MVLGVINQDVGILRQLTHGVIAGGIAVFDVGRDDQDGSVLLDAIARDTLGVEEVGVSDRVTSIASG